MADPIFRDNSKLITTASETVITANSGSDVYSGKDINGKDVATAFVFNNVEVGDDQLADFGSNDSILNYQKIFDGNNDGFIQFGANGVLDIDRTTKKKAGQDQIQVTGDNGDVTEIRYLGTKGGTGVDGMHVYANSATLKNLWAAYGSTNVMEGTVGDNTISFANGNKVLLIDNALGLNLGKDTLTNFDKGDALATTALLYDHTKEGTVGFGKNFVLDVSGSEGPKSTDPKVGPGGQLDFATPDYQAVKYLGSNEIGGVKYYYYGTADSEFVPHGAN